MKIKNEKKEKRISIFNEEIQSKPQIGYGNFARIRKKI